MKPLTASLYLILCDKLCIILSFVENGFATVPIGAIYVSEPSGDSGSNGPAK